MFGDPPNFFFNLKLTSSEAQKLTEGVQAGCRVLHRPASSMKSISLKKLSRGSLKYTTQRRPIDSLKTLSRQVLLERLRSFSTEHAESDGKALKKERERGGGGGGGGGGEKGERQGMQGMQGHLDLSCQELLQELVKGGHTLPVDLHNLVANEPRSMRNDEKWGRGEGMKGQGREEVQRRGEKYEGYAG